MELNQITPTGSLQFRGLAQAEVAISKMSAPSTKQQLLSLVDDFEIVTKYEPFTVCYFHCSIDLPCTIIVLHYVSWVLVCSKAFIRLGSRVAVDLFRVSPLVDLDLESLCIVNTAVIRFEQTQWQ